MRARSRNVVRTLVLLAAAAAAIAWAWLGVERGDRREKATKEREARVFAFAASDVVAIEVTARGQVTRLERDGAHWKVASPPPAGPADDLAANGIAGRLASLERLREAAPASAPAGELGRFGLLLPRARVEVTLASGAKETLALGEDSTFDGTLYVRPTSGAVLVVAGENKWALERGTEEFRRREPTSTPTSTPTATPPRPPAANPG